MAEGGEQKKVRLILKGAVIHIPELIIEEEE